MSGFAATCRALMNAVAATPMRIRHASLVIDRLRWGPADCESLFSAKNIFDSLVRPRARSGESDCGDYEQTGQFKYQKLPMPVNTLGWIQSSTFRLRFGYEVSTESGSDRVTILAVSNFATGLDRSLPLSVLTP